MRHDYHHLILEAKRAVDSQRRGHRGVAFEDLPTKERMRHGTGWTSQGDRLRPLTRAIEASVGRPWNKVHSELLKHADRRTLRGQHLREHIDDYVDPRDLREVGSRYGVFFYRARPYFVDAHGILRKYPERERWPRRAPRSPTRHQLDDGRVIEQIDGIWYEVWEETVAEPRVYASSGVTTIRYVDKQVPRKRQLGKKELREFGVSNTCTLAA